MLSSLHIENMAVIASLDVDFNTGLSVITGETGSGKSVMLGALSFLLGGRSEREMLRHGAETALVSAVFTDLNAECLAFLREAGFSTDGELLLQRTLTADGRSKCRLNGRAIPQSMLRELSGHLVSIHAQNDNQLLLQAATQHKILNSISDFGVVIDQYRALYAKRRETEASLRALMRDAGEAARLCDILRFQISEIDAAKLRQGEEEELEAKREKLQNAEKIAKQAEFAYRILYGSEKGAAALILERAAQAMHQLSFVVPEAAEAEKKLTEMRYEVEEIANMARDLSEENEGDPTAALDRVEGRLDTISKLRRKYGEDIAAVLAFREGAANRLAGIENSDEEQQRLTALYKKQTADLRHLAAELHAARARAAKTLSAGVMEGLSFLDMPGVRFEVAVRETDTFLADGTDEVEFCISTNPGDPLLPLSRIASGGELARIMLALKSVLNDRDGVDTAVFDEVDTGISGKTSRKIGMKLAGIGTKTQVICITHSAQIASLATTHYKISKTLGEDAAYSTVCVLDDAGRVDEVARILGGLSITQAQKNAARDMIEEGRAYR